MKFFVDTANLDQIKEAQDLGVLDGVTTNPSLMAKEGITGHDNIMKHYVDICNIVDGDVSAEVIATDFDGMLKEGDSITFQLGAKNLFGESFDLIASHHDLEESTTIFVHTGVEAIMAEDSFKSWEAKKMAMLQKNLQEQAETQLKEDIETIKAYLKEHAITAHSIPSGISYVIYEPGKGKSPQPGNKVKVDYTGQTLDGKVFDTSIAEIAKENDLYNPLRTYAPFEFELGANQVIQGWEEVLPLLKKGARAKLFIPSTLAYGRQAIGEVIKPNAILIFDITLLDIL